MPKADIHLEETHIRTKVVAMEPPDLHCKNPICLRCGNSLEVRKFVDVWGPDGNPCEVNEDLYCPNCDLRWMSQRGPHDFFKEGD